VRLALPVLELSQAVQDFRPAPVQRPNELTPQNPLAIDDVSLWKFHCAIVKQDGSLPGGARVRIELDDGSERRLRNYCGFVGALSEYTLIQWLRNLGFNFFPFTSKKTTLDS
jgi:hypothetical protein